MGFPKLRQQSEPKGRRYTKIYGRSAFRLGKARKTSRTLKSLFAKNRIIFRGVSRETGAGLLGQRFFQEGDGVRREEPRPARFACRAGGSERGEALVRRSLQSRQGVTLQSRLLRPYDAALPKVRRLAAARRGGAVRLWLSSLWARAW